MAEKITVPTLGESVTEATVSKWLKAQGEKVVADEPIVELETDKVNVEVPAPSNGVLSNIAVKEGETVNVGSLLGTINGGTKAQPPVKEVKKYSPPPKEEKEIKKEVKPISEQIKKTPPIKKPAPVKKIEVAQGIKEEEPLILDQLHEEVSISKNISQKSQEARVAPSAMQ